MHATRLYIKFIFFFASLTLSYSRHISFDVEDVKRSVSQEGNCERVCMTPGCVKTAASIISNMDESVDPCDNFYQFACGTWLKSNDIPEGKKKWGLFEAVDYDVERKLKALVAKKLDGTEPFFVKILKDLYDTCMDLETIDKLGSEPLRKDLAILGGWPVVEGSQWNESSFDWVDTVIAFRRLGYHFDMLINLYVDTDMPNETANIIKLSRPSLGSGRQNLISGLNDSETADHYKVGVKEAILLGADENTAEEEILKALEFEIELAKISMSEEEQKENNEIEAEKEDNEINTEFTPNELKRIILSEKKKERKKRDAGPHYTIYTVAELQNMIPEIPWLRFFNGLMNYKIGEEESIAVFDPVLLKNIASLLEKTEKRVVANYMFWLMVDQVKYDLSKEWREIEPRERTKDENRREMCFEKVSDSLSVALHSYYIRQYFKEDSKNAVMELIKYVHRELLRILEGADWMDDETKKEAIEKANSMKTVIGYPTELLNDTIIMEMYKNLTISNSSYYENVMNLRKWSIDTHFSSLRKLQKSQWTTYAEAAEVNAYYHLEENTIGFPGGILQGVFFDKDRPHYMNFGGIGYVIGHEITHGFDVEGKEYDKDGNKVEWWDKTTDELYHKRVQCMVEQYSNYTLESGLKIDGVLTQSENIADNGGLKEAYRAYHTWVRDHGPEPLLPGIKYNQNQLFWISAANVWCSKMRPEVLERRLKNDPHSPAEFRVIGSMSNLQEFSVDFRCSPDSPMNRKNKCHVW